MFSENKKNKQGTNLSVQNIIAKGTKIAGDFASEGDIRIDGIIEGAVNTPGKVVVGKTGEIHGALYCGSAHFEGKLIGKLELKETLTLKPSAIIEGEVLIGKLVVDPGAVFNVTCVMKKQDDNAKAKKAN